MAKLNINFEGDTTNLRKAIKDSDALIKQLQNTAKSITINIGGTQANKNLNTLNARLETTKQLLNDIKSISSGLNVNIGATSRDATASKLQQEKIALAESRTATQRYREEVARLQAQLAALRVAQGQNRSQTVAASGSYKEAQNRLRDLGNAIRNAEGGFKGTNPAIKEQIEEYRRLNEQLKKFDASMGNHQRNVGNYRSVLGGLKQGLESLIASYISFQTVITAVGYAFNTGLKTDALETSLKFITGSSEQTAAAFVRLQATAERLGVRYVDLAGSYKSFIGASSASNFSLVEAEKIFGSVTNAGAKLKLTSDQMTGALLALQQMISKGNVQAEELRGQLGERLPGAFAIAARAMGVTEMELNKMLQRGEVLAVDLLPKLATELDNTFGNDTTEKVESLQASVNNLFNAFDEAIQKGNIAKFFQFAIIDPATYAVQQLGRIFNPTSVGEFTERFFSFKSADLIRGINQAGDLGAQSLQNSTKLLESNNATAQQVQLTYNDLAFSLQKAREQLEIYKKAVGDGKLNEGGKRDIKEYEGLVNSLASRLAQFGRLIPKNLLENKIEVPDGALKSIAEIQKRISDLKKLPGSAIIGDDVFNRIKALQDRLKALRGTSVKVTFEPGSFKDLQDQLNKLRGKADSSIIGSDTFKQIQDLEKRIKVLGDVMKNPVTLAQMLKDNLKESVKALDKLDFTKLIKTGIEIDANIRSFGNASAVDRNAVNYQSLRGQMLADQDRWKKEKENGKKIAEDYYQAFSRGVDRFATEFYDTLTNLNQQTDATFGSIFSTLTKGLFSSFQQVFLGSLTSQLTKTLESKLTKIEIGGFSNKFSQALLTGAGLAGGVLAGIISKTSVAGQGAAGGLSGAAVGAGLGASLIKGTVAGLSGGIFGALAGGLVGIVGGIFGANKARKQQEEIQRQQLEELKKQTELARQNALAFTSAIIGQATSSGIVQGIDRDAFGNLVATIAGRDIKLSFERETAAQLRGI